MTRATPRIIAPLLAASFIAACGAGTSDTSASSGATAEQLNAIAVEAHVSVTVVQANTGPTGKVTICHYPPGNRANMQTLSVGAPAVTAHVRNHGDTIGPCGGSDAGTPSTDAGSPAIDAGSAPADAGTPATDAGYTLT